MENKEQPNQNPEKVELPLQEENADTVPGTVDNNTDTEPQDAISEESTEKKGELKEEEKEQRFKEGIQQEVNWRKYFDSIAHVCPWSKKAYMQDKILHVKTGSPGNELTWVASYSATNYEALLLEYNEGTSIDTLLAVVEKIEKK